VTTLPTGARLDPRAQDEEEPAAWLSQVRAGGDPESPNEQLAKLATLHVWARWAVASNPSCPAHLLEMLALDLAPLVRRAVAKNPSTPRAVAAALEADPDDRVHP
jgi:hypothetical protein